MNNHIQINRRQLFITWIYLSPTALVMLILTWDKWADPIIDFGRELYVPWRLSLGETLYRDVAYFNGPLSPYVNSLFFRIFPVSVKTLIFANLFLAFLVLVLLYRIFKRLEGEKGGRLACMLFLSVFAFGRMDQVGNYNFVTPYSHELLHGIVLILFEIWCLGRYEVSAKGKWLCLAGLLSGICFLTKPEIFLASFLVLLLACGFVIFRQKGAAMKTVLGAFFIIPLPLLIAWILMGQGLGSGHAFGALFFPWQSISSQIAALPFYRKIVGLDHPALNIARIAVWTLAWVLVVLISSFLQRMVYGFWKHRIGMLAAALATVLMARIGFDDFIRPLPLVLVLCSVIWLREGKNTLLKLSLCASAFVLLAKIILNAQFHRYGFSLSMLGAIAVAIVTIHYVPRVLNADSRYFNGFGSAASGIWISLVVIHICMSFGTLAQIRFPVGNGSDRFLSDERGIPLQQFLTENQQQPPASLVVLPEGIMINYLTRIKNPTPYVNFMPPEMIIFGENQILRSLAEHPPDQIAVVDKDVSEYGVSVFGMDFGKKIMDWVRNNYEQKRLYGQKPFAGKGFGIQLLARNTSSKNAASK